MKISQLGACGRQMVPTSGYQATHCLLNMPGKQLSTTERVTKCRHLVFGSIFVLCVVATQRLIQITNAYKCTICDVVVCLVGLHFPASFLNFMYLPFQSTRACYRPLPAGVAICRGFRLAHRRALGSTLSGNMRLLMLSPKYANMFEVRLTRCLLMLYDCSIFDFPPPVPSGVPPQRIRRCLRAPAPCHETCDLQARAKAQHWPHSIGTAAGRWRLIGT